MIRNFFSCVEKDFKVFGRSKISAVITVAVPLLIVLLISMAFSSGSFHGIKIGTYSPEESELTQSIINNFEKEGYIINEYGSVSDCENSVKKERTQICVAFPENFSEQGSYDSIDFYVDESRMNIAYTLIEKIKSEISTKSSSLSYEMVEDLVEGLDKTKKSLLEYQEKIETMQDEMDSISDSAYMISSSSPDYNTLIDSLNEAKEILDGMNSSAEVDDTKSEIDRALLEIEDIQEKSSSLDSSASDISSETEQVIARLNDLDKKISDISEELESIRVTEIEKIVNPIKTEIYSVSGDSKNIDYLFPTLLALMVMFSGIVLSSILVIKEKKSRARFRNFITPTSNLTFILAMYFSAIIILFFQFSVLLSGLIFIGDMPMNDIILNLGVVLFFSATAFIFLGMSIGYLFRTEETGILIAISVISLLIIFSNTILPIESISAGFQNIALYNPLVVSSSILKQVILFKSGLFSVLYDFALLGGFILIFFFITYILRQGTKRFI
ncbi:MAG: ABC transporter permease [Minisyncoccales bacterium]